MEFGRWLKELVFFLELDSMGISQMDPFVGIGLQMSHQSPLKPLRIIKNISKHGIKIQINGSKIIYTFVSHLEERNLGLEALWQHLRRAQFGTDFILDII
jgi:hypothetical protein